ncbi:MAG TPA: D-alanyl-D-alanine carboxypeptidase [Chloroflexota bacterium]|nr:D-alanyl-D-alanine carboxypeptidase [Chloroflexota bacterium]
MRVKILAGLAVLLALIAAGGVYGWVQLSQPIPPIVAATSFPTSLTVEGEPPALPWPSQGAAAVAVPEIGIVGTSGPKTPRPIASIAKVMTAYLVLTDHPLAPREPGPTVGVTAEDVRIFEADLADGQSVVPVVAGEQLTEYQLLQALLLPSGNNIADLLAKWDAGSREAFVAKMNAKAGEMGMSSTRFADASGYSPQTVSTATDLIILGQAAMREPVFAEIVAQQEAAIPVAERIFNVNTDLGRGGNIGIKTGSTPEAGACFMFAARRTVNDREMVLVGAVLDQPQLSDAFARSSDIAAAAARGVRMSRVLDTSTVVGTYAAPWGPKVDAMPAENVDFLAWPGMAVSVEAQLDPIEAPLQSGDRVGLLSLKLGDQSKTVELVASGSIPSPGRTWRLLRPLRELGVVSSTAGAANR